MEKVALAHIIYKSYAASIIHSSASANADDRSLVEAGRFVPLLGAAPPLLIAHRLLSSVGGLDDVLLLNQTFIQLVAKISPEVLVKYYTYSEPPTQEDKDITDENIKSGITTVLKMVATYSGDSCNGEENSALEVDVVSSSSLGELGGGMYPIENDIDFNELYILLNGYNLNMLVEIIITNILKKNKFKSNPVIVTQYQRIGQSGGSISSYGAELTPYPLPLGVLDDLLQNAMLVGLKKEMDKVMEPIILATNATVLETVNEAEFIRRLISNEQFKNGFNLLLKLSINSVCYESSTGITMFAGIPKGRVTSIYNEIGEGMRAMLMILSPGQFCLKSKCEHIKKYAGIIATLDKHPELKSWIYAGWCSVVYEGIKNLISRQLRSDRLMLQSNASDQDTRLYQLCMAEIASSDYYSGSKKDKYLEIHDILITPQLRFGSLNEEKARLLCSLSYATYVATKGSIVESITPLHTSVTPSQIRAMGYKIEGSNWTDLSIQEFNKQNIDRTQMLLKDESFEIMTVISTFSSKIPVPKKKLRSTLLDNKNNVASGGAECIWDEYIKHTGGVTAAQANILAQQPMQAYMITGSMMQITGSASANGV